MNLSLGDILDATLALWLDYSHISSLSRGAALNGEARHRIILKCQPEHLDQFCNNGAVLQSLLSSTGAA